MLRGMIAADADKRLLTCVCV